MSLADLAAFMNAVAVPHQTLYFRRGPGGSGPGGGNPGNSTWLWTPLVGTAPSTAVVPAQDALGALGQSDGAGALRIAHARVQSDGSLGGAGRRHGTILWICDRLSHQGGLDGTIATEQTTNLPTAALTRYTNGVGVFAALEIYTAIGTTSQTATIRYTNQAGTANQVSPEKQVAAGAGIPYNVSQAFNIMPLAQGDSGVRSVEGVTLSGSTGTAGNFGVTLFKPLYAVPWLPPSHMVKARGYSGLRGQLAEVLDGACLFVMCVGSQAILPGFGLVLDFIET